MSEMNIITKKIIAEKILNAISHSGIMKSEAARQLEINPANISFLKDESKLKDISINVWEKMRNWINEGRSFRTDSDAPPMPTERMHPSALTEKEQKALDKLKPVEVSPAKSMLTMRTDGSIHRADGSPPLQPHASNENSGELLPGEDEIKVKVRPEALRKRASELNVSSEVDQLKKKMTIVADQSKLPEYIAQLIKDKLFSNMVDSVEVVVNLK